MERLSFTEISHLASLEAILRNASSSRSMEYLFMKQRPVKQPHIMINTASLMRRLRLMCGLLKQNKTTITSNVKKKNIVQTPFIKLFI